MSPTAKTGGASRANRSSLLVCGAQGSVFPPFSGRTPVRLLFAAKSPLRVNPIHADTAPVMPTALSVFHVRVAQEYGRGSETGP